MGYPYNNVTPLEDRRWILQHDGQFVERTEGVPHETVNMRFIWTDDREKAQEYSFKDLWNPLAIRPIGVQFTTGFSGGRAVRVK